MQYITEKYFVSSNESECNNYNSFLSHFVFGCWCNSGTLFCGAQALADLPANALNAHSECECISRSPIIQEIITPLNALLHIINEFNNGKLIEIGPFLYLKVQAIFFGNSSFLFVRRFRLIPNRNAGHSFLRLLALPRRNGHCFPHRYSVFFPPLYVLLFIFWICFRFAFILRWKFSKKV